MLLDKFKQATGKSNHGGQSLYDHTFWGVEAGLRAARLAGIRDGRPLDVMLMGLCIHDVGKLDPDFQAMITAARDGRDLPAKKVKHEASTFDYDHISLVETNLAALRDEVRSSEGYTINLDHVTAAMD
ncbi:MAG: hypothetical protein D6768_18690, partial [Chloroflexi bacterium]